MEEFEAAGRLLEAQRLEQRTNFDLEMLEATGSCAGIENYSRYLTGRKPGEPPPTLFEYLPDNALVFTDESHVTIPQIGGMFRGDFRRKSHWPSSFPTALCVDNRPMKFEEWDIMYKTAYLPPWVAGDGAHAFLSSKSFARPAVDPTCEIRPATTADDLIAECHELAKKSQHGDHADQENGRRFDRIYAEQGRCAIPISTHWSALKLS